LVFTGSGTAPDHSIIEEQKALAESAQAVVQLQTQVAKASQEVVQELIDHVKEDNHHHPQNSKLNHHASHAHLDSLGTKLVELQEKQKRAESNYLSRLQETKDTVIQLICGGTAGALARSTVAPMDRVKILMQVAHVQKTSHLYPNMTKTAQYIVKTEGITGFWRGNLTNCVRVVPHAATQFVAYDKIKIYMIEDSHGKLTVPQRLIAGSLSGVAAASVTQPLDVVRVRLQTDPEVKGKVVNAARAMWAEGGVLVGCVVFVHYLTLCGRPSTKAIPRPCYL